NLLEVSAVVLAVPWHLHRRASDVYIWDPLPRTPIGSTIRIRTELTAGALRSQGARVSSFARARATRASNTYAAPDRVRWFHAHRSARPRMTRRDDFARRDTAAGGQSVRVTLWRCRS